MRILDQRNFYSTKKLFLLGEWNGKTVLLERTEQPEPFFRILLFGVAELEQSRFRTPLRGRIFRGCELKNGIVRVLLSALQRVQILTFSLEDAGNIPAVEELALCGKVTDACLAGETGCLVRTESDEAHVPLYRRLERMTGRSAFLFYCEPGAEQSVAVQDFRLADLLPQEILPWQENLSLCGVHCARPSAEGVEYALPPLQECVVWSSWEQLRPALLRGEETLPLQLPVTAAEGEHIRLLGGEGDRRFFSLCRNHGQSLFALRLSDGTAEELDRAEAAAGEFAFVQGIGCCRVNRAGGKMQVQPLGKSAAITLPEKVGVPAAWLEGRFLLAQCGKNAVCYDTVRRESTVYEGISQLLPDGFVLS